VLVRARRIGSQITLSSSTASRAVTIMPSAAAAQKGTPREVKARVT
jgi:hypothetical protein